MKNNVSKIISFVGLLLVALIMIISNIILFEPNVSQTITNLLCPTVIDYETLKQNREQGKALSFQIVLEGSVLLKNENNILPLSNEINNVNVFGYSSIDWIYSGSGSGKVQRQEKKYEDFLSSLTSYGINYNVELTNMYYKYSLPRGNIDSISLYSEDFYQLIEPDINDKNYYTEELLSNAKKYSSTAFVVISRRAGETEDPTRIQYKYKLKNDENRHYLQISTEEEKLLKYVGQNYKDVIVIINSCNVMELSFLDIIPNLNACVLVGPTGNEGANALPYLLYGDVSFSGKLTDTYAYDMKYNINYKYSSKDGVGHYLNAKEMYPTNVHSNAGVNIRTAPAFVDYVENIYVGYKWFETAYEEGIWSNINNQYGKGYNGVVQFPFGYGLSYTSFKYDILSYDKDFSYDKNINLKLMVTNIGNTRGQDVIQIYGVAPYTKGGIEKASINLMGFNKTSLLEPNQSQIIDINIDPFDFASYDAYDKNDNGFKGYELEKGIYKLQIMNDVHHIKKVNFDYKNNIDGVIEYSLNEDIKIENDKYSHKKIFNKFTGNDSLESVSIDGSDSNQNINFISRNNFINPLDINNIEDRIMMDNVKEYNLWTKQKADQYDNYLKDIWHNDIDNKEVKWGINHNKKIYENNKITDLGLSLGEDYYSSNWNEILEQITFDEAYNFVRSGNYGNIKIDSIGKPNLTDSDGPSQIKNSLGTGFPSSSVLGQTWSKTLSYNYGLNFGKEMNALGVDGLYGFGANIHRSPWGGRNYEYYSEDSLLCADLLVNLCKGLKNTGKYAYLKHLIVQETEHERESLYTWCTEQALREIYLKTFYKAINEGGVTGIMTSYNRLGNIWTGGNTSLLTGILRNEWGFNGAIITDYCDIEGVNYMNIEQALRAGGNLLLGNKNNILSTSLQNGNRIQNRLKEAIHQALYMWLNASYVNSKYNVRDDIDEVINAKISSSWVWWIPAVIDLDIVVGSVLIGWLYLLFKKDKEKELIANEI